MKTSSNTPDGSKKASSYFLKEHNDSPIPSNQRINVKKRLMLLITLAIALAAFLMTACDDDPKPCSNCSTPIPAPAPKPTPHPTTDQLEIRSIHPSAGAPGTRVNIVLDNYPEPSGNPYVTFGQSYAEVIYARWGMVIVRVPMDLEDGYYPVNMRSSNGQLVRAPQEFRVIQGTN